MILLEEYNIIVKRSFKTPLDQNALDSLKKEGVYSIDSHYSGSYLLYYKVSIKDFESLRINTNNRSIEAVIKLGKYKYIYSIFNSLSQSITYSEQVQMLDNLLHLLQEELRTLKDES